MNSNIEVDTLSSSCRAVRSLRDALQIAFAQPGCQQAFDKVICRICICQHSVRLAPPAGMDGRWDTPPASTSHCPLTVQQVHCITHSACRARFCAAHIRQEKPKHCSVHKTGTSRPNHMTKPVGTWQICLVSGGHSAIPPQEVYNWQNHIKVRPAHPGAIKSHLLGRGLCLLQAWLPRGLAPRPATHQEAAVAVPLHCPSLSPVQGRTQS